LNSGEEAIGFYREWLKAFNAAVIIAVGQVMILHDLQ